MDLPTAHSNITINDHTYSLSHLNMVVSKIPKKGVDQGTDLNVTIVFSNHVYSNRTKYKHEYDLLDHHDTKRTFDVSRYDMSLKLPNLLIGALECNKLCFESRSFGGNLNLMMVETDEGQKWSIIFCFQPIPSGVLMEIISTHPKDVAEKLISRKSLSYYARMCIFKNTRIPQL